MDWMDKARWPNTNLMVWTMVLFFFTLRIVLLLNQAVHPVVVSVVGAIWAGGIYWGLSAFFVRSDPRIWRMGSAWFQTNLQILSADERQTIQEGLHDIWGRRLHYELVIVAAVGAFCGAIETGFPTQAMLAVMAALFAWWIGCILGLTKAES